MTRDINTFLKKFKKFKKENEELTRATYLTVLVPRTNGNNLIVIHLQKYRSN